MKNLAVAAIAAGGLLASVPPAAHADDAPVAQGARCNLASSDDPTGTVANPGTQFGQLSGGPVVFADTVGGPVAGRIVCAVQVGGTGAQEEADAATASSANGVETRGFAYLPPTAMSYQATATDAVWLCTTWIVGATAYYYDSTTGTFTTAASAKCELTISQEIPPEEVCALSPQVCDLPVLKP